jgi:HEAT repeat protein
MSSQFQQDTDFDEVREALLDNETPFPTGMLYFFSDITPADLAKLTEVWPEVWLERRRGLLEDMENMAENDTLLFFDHVAVMALEDEDPVARATAIRLLWQSEEEKLVPRLLQLLQEDPQAMVRAAAATGLGIFVYLGELEEISERTYKEIVESLVSTHLGADEVLVRRRALEALGYATHPEVPGFIQRAYDTNNEDWLQSALFAMGRTCDRERWGRLVLRMFDHPDAVVRYEAIRAAGELEMSSAREPLFDLLEEGTDDADIYFAAVWALSKIGGKGVRSLIEMGLEEAEDGEEIQFLEEALQNLDFTEQVNAFDMMVFDEDDFDDWDDDDDDDMDEDD